MTHKREIMLKKMDKMSYATSFKETLLNMWDYAESNGFPNVYYADVGSIVINGLHISNGVGDGAFRFDVIHNTDKNFETKKADYEDTGIFFYADYISVQLYDLLPESAFTCRFKDVKWAEVRRDKNGNFLIAVHS